MDDIGSSAMSLASNTGVTTIVRQQTGDQLLISACGRTCSVDMHQSRSIVDLQAALQRSLQMEGQAFHICDINGAILSTDMQVQDAISQGLTPLCATLPDKSLHHLENRREELAQMQWKLVRDQMTQGTNQVTQLTRQLNELQFQLQALQRETHGSVENCRAETSKLIENERFTTKAEILPLQEAVNGAVLLINGERSKRELSVQGFEKHIHGVCDMLDGERASRRQDMAMHMSVMQELRSTLDAERNSRLECEESVTDMKRSFQKFQEDVALSLREQTEKAQKLQIEMSNSANDVMGRFAELEDRSAVLENSIAETTSWTTGSIDRMGERQERVTQAFETMRLSTKHHEGSLLNSIERTKDFESMVRQYDSELRDALGKEKQVRDDQVRRVSQVFTSDSLKQITELEKRLTIRLERESAEREKNFQSMVDEVTTIVEDRKFFRDRTITKVVPNMTPTSPTNTAQAADSELTVSDFAMVQEKVQMGIPVTAVAANIVTTGPMFRAVQQSSEAGTPRSASATMSYGGFMTGNAASRTSTPLAQRSARMLAAPVAVASLGSNVSWGTATLPLGTAVREQIAGGSLTLPANVTGASLTLSQPGSQYGNSGSYMPGISTTGGSFRAPMPQTVSPVMTGPAMTGPGRSAALSASSMTSFGTRMGQPSQVS